VKLDTSATPLEVPYFGASWLSVNNNITITSMPTGARTVVQWKM